MKPVEHNNTCYLYRHIRLDKNEPFYIGIGSGSSHKRAYEKTRRNIHWLNIVSNTEYIVEVLLDGLSWDFAKQKEIEFIKLYGRRDINTGTLVNLTDGGEGGLNRVVSEKCLEVLKKRRGHQNPRYGKKFVFSDTHKRNISLGKKGLSFSDAHRQNISKSRIGKKLPEETKKKMSLAHLGEANHFYGKSHTEKTKELLRQKNKTYRHTDDAKERIRIGIKKYWETIKLNKRVA